MQPRIIPRSDHPISRKHIDADALKVLYRLYRSGHTAFLVGGGVRDLLIGRRPKDFDVCTSARPGQVKKLFRNCWLIGRRFRLAHIHFRDHKIVEVSTFRAQPERDEMNDEDLLVRQDNTFGSPEEDALRRDFTINGLFYDIASFSLIDYVGGVDDIEAGVIRTIGDPHVRFREDPVRMLRAIKFAARLDFAIEPETWEALCEHAEEITRCSTSRVVEEIARLLEGGASCRSVQLLKASGLLRIVLPEIYEYIYGLPAGPGLQADTRSEARESADAVEAELLLDTDEDADLEAQERILGVEGEPLEIESDAEPGADAEVAEGESSDEQASESVEGETDAAVSSSVDEDEIDLSGDDETEADVLTPQGTRCVQAPDRGGLLWRMLGSVDARVRSHRPMTRPSLYAALFYPLIRHTTEWMLGEQPTCDEESTFLGLLRPLTSTILVSRRERERVCQILAAQRKFRRNNRGFAQVLSRKPYFAESLDLWEVSTLATGEGVESLDWWRSRYPYVPPTVTAGRARLQPTAIEGSDEGSGRRSRRRRRGRAEGGREVERDFEREVDLEVAPEVQERGRRRTGAAEPDDASRGRRDDRDEEEEGRRPRARRSARERSREFEANEQPESWERPRHDEEGRTPSRSRERLRDTDFEAPFARENGGYERQRSGRDRGSSDRDRDRGGRERESSGRERGSSGRDRDRGGREREGSGRDRGSSGRDRDRGGRERESSGRERDRVDEARGPLRRREARDIERGLGDFGRDISYGRGGALRRESVGRSDDSGRSSRSRGGSGSERSNRRTPFREEGYRGPRAGDDEFEYYEARVGRDLTTDSPRPRREEGQRGTNRRRRRKPPLGH